MRVGKLCPSVALLAVLCTGCHHNNPAPPAQAAQAPPLQTGKGTLSPPSNSPQPEKTDTPLASPLPQPSAQSVPLPPPKPKKVRHNKVKTPPAKPADSAQTPTATTPGGPATQAAAAQPPGPAAPSQQAAAPGAVVSPIGQLTTGGAMGEKTKHEAADLIGTTEQGMNGIKRTLSTDEKVTATQISNYLKQAKQALDNGDADGALGLATKAKLLLDELTKP